MRFTFMLLMALVYPAEAAVAAEQAGLGGYKATLTPDNHVKYTLDAPGSETSVAVKITDMLGEEVLVTQAA